MKTCIYCNVVIDKTNRSNEHVLPKWLFKHLDARKVELGFLEVSSKQLTARRSRPSPNSLRYKICNKCNNEWLSQIDKSCIGLVKFLCDGEINSVEGRYGEDDFIRLATFLYKIFLNFFATSSFDLKSKKHLYENFKETKTHPKDVVLLNSPGISNTPLDIAHSDMWETDLVSYNHATVIKEHDSFKFFIQMGDSAFILAKTPLKGKKIIVDNSYFVPIVGIEHCRHESIPLNKPRPPIKDTIINRFLHSIHCDV